VFFGHQVGAALAAYGGGLLRVWLGTYHVAFTTAGLLALDTREIMQHTWAERSTRWNNVIPLDGRPTRTTSSG
jgi:hypothetical protein